MTIVRASRAMTINAQANDPVGSSVGIAAVHAVYASKNDRRRKYSSDFLKQLIVYGWQFIHYNDAIMSAMASQPPFSRLLNCLFQRRYKKTSKLRVTGLCGGNPPETGEFPAQRANNAENASIWWRHHAVVYDIRSVSGWCFNGWRGNNIAEEFLALSLCSETR